MINRTNLFSAFCVVFFLFSYLKTYSQEGNKITSIKTFNEVYDAEVRGRNAFSLAAGSVIANGDYPSALYEIYLHIGYKRFIGPYVNINIGFNKYNLAFKDVFNEGFMSFDANLEIVPFPKSILSPYFFAGGGVNASDYFEKTDSKVQVGAGFEILIASSIAIKFFGEYNMTFTDELDGRIYGESDDTFWRAAIGLNFYFGKRGGKKAIKKNEATVINSNPIIYPKN